MATGIVGVMSPSALLTPLRSTLVLTREALYVTVGAGVLTIQKVQVQRREWERAVGRRFAGAAGPEPG